MALFFSSWYSYGAVSTWDSETVTRAISFLESYFCDFAVLNHNYDRRNIFPPSPLRTCTPKPLPRETSFFFQNLDIEKERFLFHHSFALKILRQLSHPHMTSYASRLTALGESLFFLWLELNIKISTKQQQSYCLIEFFVFNTAFDK